MNQKKNLIQGRKRLKEEEEQEKVSKAEKLLTEPANFNEERINKVIDKYKARIKQLQKFQIQRLSIIKRQNKRIHNAVSWNKYLKTQLVQVNENLKRFLEMTAQKGKKQDIQLQRQKTEKELRNEIKKNISLSKQICSLKHKISQQKSISVFNLIDQIREKENLINNQNKKIQLLQKVGAEDKSDFLLKKRVNQLHEEVAHLKKKVDDQKLIISSFENKEEKNFNTKQTMNGDDVRQSSRIYAKNKIYRSSTEERLPKLKSSSVQLKKETRLKYKI